MLDGDSSRTEKFNSSISKLIPDGFNLEWELKQVHSIVQCTVECGVVVDRQPLFSPSSNSQSQTGMLSLPCAGLLCYSQTCLTSQEDIPFVHKARQCQHNLWSLECNAGVCVRVCVRACVRVCMHGCVCVSMRMHVCDVTFMAIAVYTHLFLCHQLCRLIKDCGLHRHGYNVLELIGAVQLELGSALDHASSLLMREFLQLLVHVACKVYGGDTYQR